MSLTSPVPMPADTGNRLDRMLASKRPLLTCYFPLGDPRMPPDVLQLYADCGVDIVELGVPTANPFMDGRDVAAAMARALSAGFSWDMLGDAAAALKARHDGPAALCMAYADMDVTAAATHPAWSMVDGLLMLGLDARADCAAVKTWIRQRRLRTVKFVNAALDAQSLMAARDADAYLMLQAADGPTGPRDHLDPANAHRIARLRALAFHQPILLGFGISTPEQAAAAVAMGADGVIIGSQCIRHALDSMASLRTFLDAVRGALDG